MKETIIILDFGSQYTQLIARKIRELNVYCEIHHYDKIPPSDPSIKGIVLSGSPFSVRDINAPKPDLREILGKIPVLGICYGAQLIAQSNGGEVMPSKSREYGRANLHLINGPEMLFQHVEPGTQVWMSHGDTISSLPDGYGIIASTKDIDVGAFRSLSSETYGLQFHPEVYHSTHGTQILQNFLVDICRCTRSWTPDSFIETAIQDIRDQVGRDNILLGLSGGVDSSVTAMLLHKAVGKQLTSIFVDNGLLRKNEFVNVMAKYKELGLQVHGVDARKKFLAALQGISDPEQKRKAIGQVFVEVFEEEARKIPGVKWLAQGTIYPDVIESVSVKGPSAKIKTHHNVGGLPEKMNLKVLEPMKLLFKDEVRRVGKSIGLDNQIMKRHPFPGPGLAVRILSDVTAEKVTMLQEADHIFINGLEENGLYDQVWQAGVMLLPVQSVGVMGDERTYEHVVALRAVTSTDGMTADWAHLPYDFLSTVSNRIINNVKGINRVVYDVSSKPPATIEWE